MANMLQLKIGSSTSRKDDVLPDDTTLKTAFAKHGIKIDGATVYLDGAAISAGDINKTFADLGCKDSATLTAVIKLDNAA